MNRGQIKRVFVAGLHAVSFVRDVRSSQAGRRQDACAASLQNRCTPPVKILANAPGISLGQSRGRRLGSAFEVFLDHLDLLLGQDGGIQRSGHGLGLIHASIGGQHADHHHFLLRRDLV